MPGPATSTTWSPTTMTGHRGRPGRRISRRSAADITGARPRGAGDIDAGPTGATTGSVRTVAGSWSRRPTPRPSTPTDREVHQRPDRPAPHWTTGPCGLPETRIGIRRGRKHHSEWIASADTPIVRTMTEVEGGLAEPTELEPEQGSLELADAGDRWTSADWEKSAAAVLRKARRLGDDDADSRVWERLSRKTLDDIAVLPLGTAAVLDELETTGRPTRSGDWDIRVHLNGPEAKLANEAALVDLDGGATSLWLELGAGLTHEDLEATLADVLL